MSLESAYRKAPVWVQNILFNLYGLKVEWHRYGRPYEQALALLLRAERWPADQLLAYQNERLAVVLHAAFERSPFYRARMGEIGIELGDIRSVQDLQHLPVIDRNTVRAHGAEMMTRRRPAREWLHGHTSGTTGTPLGLWYDRATCVMTNAVDGRQKVWGGMGERDWLGLILGRLIVPLEQRTPPFWRVNRVRRQVWFSSFHLNEKTSGAYLAEIKARKLRFLEGYPSTLFILAGYVLDRGERLDLQAVFTSSETLHAIQREAIEEAFQCRIFDSYGHAERVVFAAECPANNGKHVAEEFGFVELLDARGESVQEGEIGFLTGTSLHNTAMPMIRYRTGDLSSFKSGPCPCGRTHQRISEVTTKAEDIIVTPDGRMISPSVLTHPFKPFESLLKSQIVQVALDEIHVKLVTSEAFSNQDRLRLEGGLKERLGPEMQIRLHEVDEIPPEPSGKFRWVISHVSHDQLFDWES